MDKMSVEKWWNEICDRGKREKLKEKPTQVNALYTTKPYIMKSDAMRNKQKHKHSLPLKLSKKN